MPTEKALDPKQARISTGKQWIGAGVPPDPAAAAGPTTGHGALA